MMHILWCSFAVVAALGCQTQGGAPNETQANAGAPVAAKPDAAKPDAANPNDASAATPAAGTHDCGGSNT